jgi:FkbM family methyltransferase
MTLHSTNEQRTAEYLKKFDRERTLKYLVTAARPTILDVGANVGSTLDEFKQWWPNSIVHCFEPQLECWPDLEARARKYPAGDAVINRFAVGNAAADNATFYSHDITSAQSGFHRINVKSLDSVHLQKLKENAPEAIESYQRSINQERPMKIVRLDEYLTAAGIAHVDILKMDTQGFEPEVLEGMGARLADVDVVISELMFYDYYERSLSFSDLERWLHPAGLRLYDISHIAKNPMNGRTDWVDVVYVHERLRGRVARA